MSTWSLDSKLSTCCQNVNDHNYNYYNNYMLVKRDSSLRSAYGTALTQIYNQVRVLNASLASEPSIAF